MFGRRRRYHRGGGMGGGGGMGLFLLAMQLMSFFNFLSSSNQFFPVTLAVLAVNVAAFLRPGGIAWPSIRQACISVQGVWFQNQWKRLIYSPFIHANDFHLYYNMASFMWKAVSLERTFGSGYFLYMVCVFSLLTNFLYIAINFALAEVLDQWSYVQSCAVGFSGVIFALKVVTTHMQPRGMSMIMGVFPVPVRLACWAELIVISVLFPNVSFVGHLAGILVGLAFVSGPLKMIMDIPLSAVNDFTPAATRQSYTYRAESTGHRPPETNNSNPQRPPPRQNPSQSQTYTSYTYAAGTTGYRQPVNHVGRDSNQEEAELQEAIRRSLQHDSADLADHNNAQPTESYTTDDTLQPPGEAPPPYNPNYPTPGGLLSSETEVVSPESETPPPPAASESVRRRLTTSSAQRDRGSGGTVAASSTTMGSDRDRVRVARLKRFTDKQSS